MKPVTLDRINRILLALALSPNKSVERAALFVRLHRIREKL